MKTSSIEPIRYLSREEMGAIHNAALQILERTGMWVDHLKALEYLRGAGCPVDMDRRIAKFPAEVVESALARMRRNFADPNRWPSACRCGIRKCGLTLRPSASMRISPSAPADSASSFGMGKALAAQATLQDVRRSLKLADKLDQIAYTGLPVSAQDVPAEIRPVMMAAELVKATRKYGGIETFRRRDVGYVARIGEIVAGSREAHRRNPDPGGLRGGANAALH